MQVHGVTAGSVTEAKQQGITSFVTSSTLPFWSIFSHLYYFSPAAFCRCYSSFLWTSWPNTKIWPRGNYKMENRSRDSRNHSPLQCLLSTLHFQLFSLTVPLWHQMGQRHIKFQFHAMEKEYFSN